MNKGIECVTVGQLDTNCWLYPLEAESGEKQPCVVIDPGNNIERIIASLKKLNWIPRYICLTHGHWDHVTALPDLLEAFVNGEFKGEEKPKITMHRLDVHHLENNTHEIHHVEDGDIIGPFKVLHTPGHTQGSVCYYDEKNGVLISGDTLFEGDHGRTDLPGGSPAQMRESLKRLLALNEATVVYPGHDITTTIGAERANY